MNQIDRAPHLIAIGLFVLSFSVYLFTLAPVVTFVDSGELAAVVATNGISHPTGSPLYLIFAGLVKILPGGSLIWRLNAFSAFCAAGSIVFSFYAVLAARWSEPRLIEKAKRKKGKPKKVLEIPPPPPQSELVFIGIAAGLAWLANLALWNTATVTEVYALHMLLFAFFSFLLMNYSRDFYSGNARVADRWIALAALVAGLAISNYPPFVIVGPAVLILLLRVEKLSFISKWKRNMLLLLLITAGLLPYLLLPIRAKADPLLNWGDPSNWERLWSHVTAEQYQVFLGSPSWKVLQRLIPLWWNQWPFGFSLLMVPGLILLWRKHRTAFHFTATIAITNILYSLSYDVTDVESAPSDFETYFLPLFWIGSIWIGSGILAVRGLLPEHIRNHRRTVLLAILPLMAVALNWKKADRSDYTYADDFARSILSSVAQNAFILCPDWTFVSPSLYLQHAENFRNDVLVLDGELLRRSWYFGYLKKRAPWLYDKASGSIQEFLKELRKFENDEPYDGNVITEKYGSMMNQFLNISASENHPPYILLNLEARDQNIESYRYMEQMLKRPPYISTGLAPGDVGSEFEWVPETPAFRLYQGGFQGELPHVNIPARPIELESKYDNVTKGVIRRYANFWRWRGDYYRDHNDCASAEKAYLKSLSIVSDWQESKQGLELCRSN